MKLKIKHLVHKLRVIITHNFTTRSGQGSGLGIYIRRVIRHLNLEQIIGVNLAGLAFFAGIVVPQTHEVFSNLEVTLETQETILIADAKPSTYQWPLKQFGISQNFSYYHPGIDLTDPIGTPVYPIGNGTVDWIQSTSFGYGRHLLISHEGGIKSLYAHLSKISVSEGQKVTKETEVGTVGMTGRTTGSHLHLEIYDDNIATNPLEILPLLKSITPTVALPPKT